MSHFFKGLFLTLALLLCIALGWFVISGFFRESRSIEIIGGADGPTAILIADPNHHTHQ